MRVPNDYYGVNYPRLWSDSVGTRNTQLAAIAKGGISQVRFTVNWVDVEPNAPEDGNHTYSFAITDPLVKSIAQQGLTSQVTFTTAPYWNLAQTSNTLACLGWPNKAPGDLDAYGLAIGALVHRYGTDGSFWSQNPGVPYRPIRDWEVWNEPNLKGEWCPAPEPDRYAKLLKGAEQKIHSADPEAQVVMGGMPLDSPSKPNLSPKDFIADVYRHQPSLKTSVDAIGVHVYPWGQIDNQLVAVKAFRKQLQAAGVPDSTPMFMNELGWSTAGLGSLTEPERKARFKLIPAEIQETNCNVDAVDVHAWTTSEQDHTDIEDFYGIANPVGAFTYPSGHTYEKTIALMRGQKKREAPHKLINLCKGMPAPDHDGDGYTDDHDYYPYDPSQWEGPPGWNRYPHSPKAERDCKSWYRGTKTWTGGGVPHSTILHVCEAEYLALKKAGQLRPLIDAARSGCRASVPPAHSYSGHHRARRRNQAVKRCAYAAIRHALALHF